MTEQHGRRQLISRLGAAAAVGAVALNAAPSSARDTRVEASATLADLGRRLRAMPPFKTVPMILDSSELWDGTPEAPAHVMQAELLDANKQVLAHWDTASLTTLAESAIRNDYAYNKFKAGPFGLTAAMGAKASITLPPADDAPHPTGPATLRLTDVNGGTFSTAVSPAA